MIFLLGICLQRTIIWKLIYETKFITEKRTHNSTFLYHSVDGNICANSLLGSTFLFSTACTWFQNFWHRFVRILMLTYLCMSSWNAPPCASFRNGVDFWFWAATLFQFNRRGTKGHFCCGSDRNVGRLQCHLHCTCKGFTCLKIQMLPVGQEEKNSYRGDLPTEKGDDRINLSFNVFGKKQTLSELYLRKIISHLSLCLKEPLLAALQAEYCTKWTPSLEFLFFHLL